MNRFESKYFHTASLMNEALITLLLKRDFELITVKDICQKAGVNRSTFYLHYENTYDLLRECIENTNKKFICAFENRTLSDEHIASADLSDLIFISDTYLLPFLTFVKENKTIYRAAHTRPEIFQSGITYNRMYESVFNPILKRFGSPEEDNLYMMEYYAQGISALILRWVERNCPEEEQKIADLIIRCVLPGEGDR